jgi:hypothetical protein
MNINFYKKYYGFFLSIIDLIIFYLSLLIVVVLRFQNNFSSQIIFDHLFAFTPLIILSIFLYFINNLYDYGFKLKGSDFVAFFGRTQFFILFIGVIYFYIIPIGLTPKTNLLLFWVLASLIIYFNHMFVSYKNPLEKINILFLQNTKLHSSIQKSINNNDFFGIKVFIYPETSDLDYLKDFVIQNNIQTIVLDDKKIPKEKLYSLLFDNINFQTFEAFYETIFRKIPVEVIEHDWFLEKINTNKYSLTVFIKRMFDVILSLLFLIITFPLWIIVIILIKLTSNGPVFYLSKRCGKNNKDIILYLCKKMLVKVDQLEPYQMISALLELANSCVVSISMNDLNLLIS